ncbi:MAG: hypothetical protein M1816_002680 [Peltula sp. TS41687]|nr:MAG: hypothetical protein M1816_002680 [Peltula sp. TS41687]
MSGLKHSNIASSDDNLMSSAQQKTGQYTCDYPGCEEKTFRFCSARERHVATHTKPFPCTEPGCITKCATNGLLQRHMREKHKQGLLTENMLFCPSKDCTRPTKPFTRQENLRDHVIRCHPNLKDPNEGDKVELTETLTEVSATVAEDIGDKKRKKKLTHAEENKRLKAEKAALEREVEDLRVENKLLHGRLKVFARISKEEAEVEDDGDEDVTGELDDREVRHVEDKTESETSEEE